MWSKLLCSKNHFTPFHFNPLKQTDDVVSLCRHDSKYQNEMGTNGKNYVSQSIL